MSHWILWAWHKAVWLQQLSSHRVRVALSNLRAFLQQWFTWDSFNRTAPGCVCVCLNINIQFETLRNRSLLQTGCFGSKNIIEIAVLHYLSNQSMWYAYQGSALLNINKCDKLHSHIPNMFQAILNPSMQIYWSLNVNMIYWNLGNLNTH